MTGAILMASGRVPTMMAMRFTGIVHKPPNGAAYGVPALAGETRFRPESRNISSRFQGARPSRLKPGLHTLRKPTVVDASCASFFPYETCASPATGHSTTRNDTRQRQPESAEFFPF